LRGFGVSRGSMSSISLKGSNYKTQNTNHKPQTTNHKSQTTNHKPQTISDFLLFNLDNENLNN
jgi:hypothetical protein